MGGLVARTFLSENPQWADRIAAMYLVGTPNLGSVKAIKTLVVGPGGLKENATSFPASLLNLLPNNVDANLTKLVAITRPSLYELLPFDDPRWECVAADGSRDARQRAGHAQRRAVAALLAEPRNWSGASSSMTG